MSIFQSVNSERVNAKIYNPKQTSVLSNALLVAGIGFISTSLIGFLFAWIFSQNSFNGDNLYYLGGPLLFLSVILSIVWQFRIEKASNFFMFSVVSLYCVSNGIGFGSIFLALEMSQIMIAFGMTGFIFLGTFAISKIMSDKVALGLGAILFIASIAYIIASIIISLTSFFMIGRSNVSYFNVLIISSIVGGLISVGYLAYSLWTIQNMDRFLNVNDETRKKYSIFFGFLLLMNLISIFWRILQLMLVFNRN